MPRYVVERTFPDGPRIPPEGDGADSAWRSSNATLTKALPGSIPMSVRTARRRSVSATPRTPRRSGRQPARNNLPVDRITQVRVLDPYFYG